MFTPRAFLGVCLFVALLASVEVRKNKILQIVNNLFVFIFIYSLISFSNSYGNALKSQKEYENFRFALLTNNLSKLTPSSKNEIKLHIQNDIGYSKPVLNASFHYPLIKRLIPAIEKQRGVGHRYMQLRYFGLKIRKCKNISCKEKGLKIIVSTAFHTIEKSKDSDCYIVTFK